MFLTAHRDLRQSYVYSEGGVAVIAVKDGRNEMSHEGLSGREGPELFDGLGAKLDDALRVAGEFNVINSLAAFAAAHAVGVKPEEIAASLSRFAGVHRRFEFTGLIDGVKMYHDYGHNPAEMRAALSVAKMQHPNHLWAVMQPHTYSRVKGLFEDYLTCTEIADYTLVTDIFAAREKDPGDIKAEMVVEGMRAHGVDAVHTPTFDDTEKYLRAHWQPGDLVLTMGCGNINLLNEQMQLHGDTDR